MPEINYPDRDELAFALFAADNRRAKPEVISRDFNKLKALYAETREPFYVYPLADAALEAFRKANS